MSDRLSARALTGVGLCMSVVLACAHRAPAVTMERAEEPSAWCRVVGSEYQAVEFSGLGGQDTAIVVRPNAAGAFAAVDRTWPARNERVPYAGTYYHLAGSGRVYAAPRPPRLRAELVPVGDYDGGTLYGWLDGDSARIAIYVIAPGADPPDPCRLYFYLHAREMRQAEGLTNSTGIKAFQ
jgi:hypothetical protein